MGFTLVAPRKLQAEIGKEVKVIAHDRETKNLTVTKIMTRARPESIFLCHASYQRRSNVRSSGFKQMSYEQVCSGYVLLEFFVVALVPGRSWNLSRSTAKRRMVVQM